MKPLSITSLTNSINRLPLRHGLFLIGLALALLAMPEAARGQVQGGDLFATVNLGGTFNNPFSAVFQYAPDGTHSTFVPNLNAPRGLAFDSNGNFFVVVNNIDDASNVNASVLKIPSGGPPFASFPTNFFATGLAIDGINNVFVIGITFPNGFSGDAAPGRDYLQNQG